MSSVSAAGHSRLIGRQFLPMLLSLPCFSMITALCYISFICPVEIDDVGEIVMAPRASF